jgi:hypothetical protein
MLNVTQTGVVMSKTVKRVMTVMMIGLVALLGANAEAHTRWINGKPRICSICSKPDETTLEEVLQDPNALTSLVVAELTVKTKEVVIKCPDGTEVQLKNKMTLMDESPLIEWNADRFTAKVDFFVSDEPIGKLVVPLRLCGGALPYDVEIHRMQAEYKAYACTSPDPREDPCSEKALISSMKLSNCRVPPDADDDTEYVCDAPEFNHVF